MKFSIAIDLRDGRNRNRSLTPNLEIALKREEQNGVTIIRLYGKSRYASVEAPDDAFERLQAAVGESFIVSPAFAVETLRL